MEQPVTARNWRSALIGGYFVCLAIYLFRLATKPSLFCVEMVVLCCIMLANVFKQRRIEIRLREFALPAVVLIVIAGLASFAFLSILNPRFW